MAGTTGLEPATSGVTGLRSNQLSYDPEFRPGTAAAGRDAEYTETVMGCKRAVAVVVLVLLLEHFFQRPRGRVGIDGAGRDRGAGL